MLLLFLCHIPSSTLNQSTDLVCSVVLKFDIPCASLWLQIWSHSAFHSIVPLLIKLWNLDHNPLAWGIFKITLSFFMARNRPWTISTKQKNNRLGDILVPDTIVGKSPCQQLKLAFTHHLKWDTLVAQTVKRLPTVGDPGSIPGLGRFPGEGNDNPLQYACLDNPMDGGTWLAIVHGVAKNQTRLSNFTFIFTFFVCSVCCYFLILKVVFSPCL